MMSSDQLEKFFWSIALPGFGQLLNGKFLKGALFILLEVIINVQANLNQAIILSFHMDISKAITQTNYGWLMFYPCVYLFAIWDAYKDAKGEVKPFMFLPFVFSAYFGTIGVILSSKLKIGGYFIGPIWLPILFLWIGVGIGNLIRIAFLRVQMKI